MKARCDSSVSCCCCFFCHSFVCAAPIIDDYLTEKRKARSKKKKGVKSLGSFKRRSEVELKHSDVVVVVVFQCGLASVQHQTTTCCSIFFLSRVKVKSGTCNLNSICGCFSGKAMTQVSSNVVCDAVESLDFAGARLSCPDFLFFLGCFQLSHLSSLLTLCLFSHSWSCAQLQAYK